MEGGNEWERAQVAGESGRGSECEESEEQEEKSNREKRESQLAGEKEQESKQLAQVFRLSFHELLVTGYRTLEDSWEPSEKFEGTCSCKVRTR